MTSELMHQASDVLRARTAFLSGDERAPAVRPEILASWRRSALLGAQPDIPTLPFCAEIDSEDALHVAACSVQIGLGLTDAAPGSMRGTYLAVTDIGAARQELTGRGVKVSRIRHKSPVDDWKGGWEPGADPQRRDYASFADFADPDGNTWVLQEICYRPGIHRD